MTKNKTQLMGEVEILALATDGSKFSDGAVQEAIFLGQACGAKLFIFHVISIDTEMAISAHAISSATRSESKDYIQNIKKMADDTGIDCEVIIEESYQPDKTIVELAYRNNVDVIIMGRHGRRGLLKLLVGSMTSKVIGHGFPLVLVVPRDFIITGQRILLTTDGSINSQLAAQEAISMGENCSTLKESYILAVATKEDNLDKARKLAESVCTMAKSRAVETRCIPMALVGRPSEIIAETALEKNVDMILIGGHGKGITKLLMGHVTEKVIGRTHCAVLVINREKGS